MLDAELNRRKERGELGIFEPQLEASVTREANRRTNNVQQLAAANWMAITTATNGWLLLFTGVSNQPYVVQSADSVNGPWSDLSSVLTSSASGLVQYNDQTLTLPKTRFYRVRPGP
jgi:hypothetical protein